MDEEMSGDEVVTLIAACIIAAVGGLRWYAQLFRVTRLGARPGSRTPLFLAPPACIGVLAFVLLEWSAKEVRTDPRYIALFLAVGAAWLVTWGEAVLPLAGLSVREDALERRNPAATAAICGALLGATLSFAGANAGEGPTIWTTIGPAFLASAGLACALFALRLTTGAIAWITVDRDRASGLRLAALLVASGLVLGRAIAGDYQSADDTLRDFASQGWPALVLLALAIAAGWACRPTARAPEPDLLVNGVLPSMALLAAAAAWLFHLGAW